MTADSAQARDWFQRGCDGGDGRSCNDLGFIYQYGHGVKVDLVHAAALYKMACDEGNAMACDNLKTMP